MTIRDGLRLLGLLDLNRDRGGYKRGKSFYINSILNKRKRL